MREGKTKQRTVRFLALLNGCHVIEVSLPKECSAGGMWFDESAFVLGYTKPVKYLVIEVQKYQSSWILNFSQSKPEGF